MLQKLYRNLWDLEPRRNRLQTRTDEYKGNATVWSLTLALPVRECIMCKQKPNSLVVPNNEIVSSSPMQQTRKLRPSDFPDPGRLKYSLVNFFLRGVKCNLLNLRGGAEFGMLVDL